MLQDQDVDFDRKWYVMAAVSMGTLLSTIDISIVNVALPTLVRDLETDFATVQWVVLAYLLMQATLLLSFGRLGDMIGKKTIYTSGFVVFTIGSVLCGFAPTVYWLIGFRAVQAIGAAMILALSLAIITEAFPPAERGKALGVTGTMVSIGIVVGPTLGGIIIDALTWNWIFFVNIPVGILGTWMAHRNLPNFRPIGNQSFDYLGGLTLFLSVLSLLLALTLGQGLGFASRVILALFFSSVVMLVLFIAIELRVDHPMIDLRLFSNRLFSINLVTGLTTFIAIAGSVLLNPFYLELALGYDTRQVGFMLAIVPVALGVVAPLSGMLSDRLGTRPISIAGLVVLVFGYGALSTLDSSTSTLGFILRYIPIGIGMGMFQSPNNSAIMGTAPRDRLGVASGLLSITRTMGQTVGIAVLGAVWAGRVFAKTGQTLPGGATNAPILAQVAALQDTYRLIASLIVLGLLLSVWGALRARRTTAAQVSTAG